MARCVRALVPGTWAAWVHRDAHDGMVPPLGGLFLRAASATQARAMTFSTTSFGSRWASSAIPGSSRDVPGRKSAEGWLGSEVIGHPRVLLAVFGHLVLHLAVCESHDEPDLAVRNPSARSAK